MKTLRFALVASIAAVLAAGQQPAGGQEPVGEEEAVKLGTEIYIYGYPLVTMEMTRRIMTNADISKIVDTTDEWIVERTGIRARHIAAEDETTRSLAVQSARNALEHAKLTPADIDLIIVATSTPDKTFPATATQVQADLGITRGAAFDVQAVCSGFVYGLTIADNFIKGGNPNALLSLAPKLFHAFLTGMIEPPACSLAMAPAQLLWVLRRAWATMMIVAFWVAIFIPMAATVTSSMLMEAHRQPRLLVTCAWKAVKYSSTP